MQRSLTWGLGSPPVVAVDVPWAPPTELALHDKGPTHVQRSQSSERGEHGKHIQPGSLWHATHGEDKKGYATPSAPNQCTGRDGPQDAENDELKSYSLHWQATTSHWQLEKLSRS
jgi:hypothetical protein